MAPQVLSKANRSTLSGCVYPAAAIQLSRDAEKAVQPINRGDRKDVVCGQSCRERLGEAACSLLRAGDAGTAGAASLTRQLIASVASRALAGAKARKVRSASNRAAAVSGPCSSGSAEARGGEERQYNM